MEEKQAKPLSLKEQLQKDILSYNQQIVNLTAKINQLMGAKLQAEEIMKKLDKDK